MLIKATAPQKIGNVVLTYVFMDNQCKEDIYEMCSL